MFGVVSLGFGVQFDLPGLDRGGGVVETQVEARLSGRSCVDLDAVPGSCGGDADLGLREFDLYAVGLGGLAAGFVSGTSVCPFW